MGLGIRYLFWRLGIVERGTNFMEYGKGCTNVVDEQDLLDTLTSKRRYGLKSIHLNFYAI